MIDISKLDKAEVLAALYNASAPRGLGFLQATAGNMSAAEARELLKAGAYFDYLRGRVMKVDLSGNELREDLFDRDNGRGAAADALAPLLAKVAA